MNSILEICAGSLSSALAAQAGGAQRIELCDNLSEGGTTPSAGNIIHAVKLLSIPVFVLVRPRAGDFLYTDDEFAAMREDVLFCKKHGAKGVVFGILAKDGNIDAGRCNQLVELARPMQVTFHRAFDMTPDPFQALEDIIGLGFDRILTSGQAATAASGAGLISRLISRAAGRIIIMPGSGIDEFNITELKRITGAGEYHASLRSPVKSRMEFRNRSAFMGKPDGDEFITLETDPERVGQFLINLNS